jgi:hypothetical protein
MADLPWNPLLGPAVGSLPPTTQQNALAPELPLPPERPPMYTAGPAPGLVEPGNIDLLARPQVRNPDGSVSTVRSMGVNIGGKELLIPTVAADGSRILSEQEAVEQYRRTGQHLGVFASPRASDAYAQALHLQQEKIYPQPSRGRR